jgi:hypothetical protein
MFYIRSDLFGLTGDPATGVKPKPWLSTDFADEELTLEDLVFPFPFVDPSRLLATFEKVSGDIESLGEEDVRGEPTRRYRLTLDLGRLIETAPARDRAALRGELEERTEKTEPVEIWIDEDGRARRVRLVEDTGDVATIEFFDFGIEADVEAPPKDQVEDFGALFDQGG